MKGRLSALESISEVTKPAGPVQIAAILVDSDTSVRWREDFTAPGVAAYRDQACKVKGLRRGLCIDTTQMNPGLGARPFRIVALCTGRTTQSRRLSKLQRQYSMKLGEAKGEFLLFSTPASNGWALCNDSDCPNCAFISMDIEIFQEDIRNLQERPSQPRLQFRSKRSGAVGPYSQSAWVAVTFLVQIKSADEDGVLKVWYGKEYERSWRCDSPQSNSIPVITATEAESFLKQFQLSQTDIAKVLLLNGAPLDNASQSMRRALYSSLPPVHPLGRKLELNSTPPTMTVVELCRTRMMLTMQPPTVSAAAAQEPSGQQPVEHAPSEPARAGGDVSQPLGDAATTTQALCSAEQGSGARPDAAPTSVSSLLRYRLLQRRNLPSSSQSSTLPASQRARGGSVSQPRFDVGHLYAGNARGGAECRDRVRLRHRLLTPAGGNRSGSREAAVQRRVRSQSHNPGSRE